MASLLPYIQIVLSVLLVAAILLQRAGSSLGGAFGGGDNWSAGFHTRRGFEKFIFIATIVIALMFAFSSFLSLIV
jgi:protein translocase SecG subunit